MRAIFIPTVSDMQMEERFINVSDPTRTNWEILGAEIKASFIERVRVGWATARKGFADAILVVDEEGNTPWKHLPRNVRASYLYGHQIHGSSIHGDALLVGEGFVLANEGVDFMDLPPHYTVEALDRLLADDDGDALFPN